MDSVENMKDQYSQESLLHITDDEIEAELGQLIEQLIQEQEAQQITKDQIKGG